MAERNSWLFTLLLAAAVATEAPSGYDRRKLDTTDARKDLSNFNAHRARHDEAYLPNKMNLRLTPDGIPDVASLERLERMYHRSLISDERRRRLLRDNGPQYDLGASADGNNGLLGRGGIGLVDYGAAHPYDFTEAKNERELNVVNEGDTTSAQENPFKPIRIWVNTDYLDLKLANNPLDGTLERKINFLKFDVFPEAVEIWSDILRVYPALRIEIDKDSQCPGFGIAVQYDLVIFAKTGCTSDQDADDRPNSLRRIASGRSCMSDAFDRPVAGFANFCLDAIDASAIDSDDARGRRFVVQTVLHEFAHILGFYWKDFAHFRHPRTGRPRTETMDFTEVTCRDGKRQVVRLPDDDTIRSWVDPDSGITRYEITTETVVSVARNQFDCQTMTGAWLENDQDDTGDCFGSHWDFRLFSTEIMAATASTTRQFLSPLTVALMEDSGWYRGNYGSRHIQMSPFGHVAGCDFVYESCIVGGNVPSYSQGTFCTSAKQLGCDSSHRDVAKCSQFRFRTPIEPKAFQYFSDPNVGGSRQMDYCPVYGALDISNGGEANEIHCNNPDLGIEAFTYNVERFGENSRCFDTSFERPLCFQAFCNEGRSALEIVFGGGIIRTCLFDGQQIEIPELLGQVLTCPRLAQVCPDLICKKNCAGRGICDSSELPPRCMCNDQTDPSPYCANSPVGSLAPTVSPSPTYLNFYDPVNSASTTMGWSQQSAAVAAPLLAGFASYCLP